MEPRPFIIALHDSGKIHEETFEAIAFVRGCRAAAPSLVALSGREVIDSLSSELAHRTGLEVIGVAGDSFREYCAEAYVRFLVPFFRGLGDVFIVVPHTSRGIDFAPQLSVGINACCITAVDGVGEGGTFLRPLYGGRFRGEIRPDRPSAVLTVLPGAFKPDDDVPLSPGKVRIVPAGNITISTRCSGIREAVHANASLSRAEVVVSVGRGLGGPEKLPLVRVLSSLFPKSAIGATRAVCDLGWLDYTHQIGSTGNTVAPRLYLACGISGAVQHISGMMNSQLIVAVNTDPDAAIFRVAHYGIVEDLSTFMPLLVDLYRGKR